MGKIFVIGDIHGRTEELHFLKKEIFSEQKTLNKNDVLVQLGDFGLIWYYESCKKQKRKDDHLIDRFFATRNFTTLVVPGNHDNYDVINNLPLVEKWDGLVYEYKTHSGHIIYIAKRGAVYKINGKTVFTFSGATTSDINDRFSYEDYLNKNNKKATISKISYWPQELSSEEEKDFAYSELMKVNFNVDYVFSHTGPKEIVSEMLDFNCIFKDKMNCDTAEFLSSIFNLINVKEWHFGHLHKDVSLVKDDILFECHYMGKPKLVE